MSKYVVRWRDSFDNEIVTSDEQYAHHYAENYKHNEVKDLIVDEVSDGYEPETMVVISKYEYDNLKINSAKYQSLESEGVDSWNGYQYAVKNYKEKTGKEWWE